MINPDRIRVLIAEDESEVREALVALIRSESHFELIGAAADAEEAIMLATRERPEVAVLDVRMPGGGASASRAIKLGSPDTKILALSGFGDRAIVLEMLGAGADGFLVKGDAPSSILRAIQLAAAGRATLSAEVTSEVIQELAERMHAGWQSDEHAQSRTTRIQHVLESGALHMVYQPICRLDGRTDGAEALARFDCEPRRSPDRWFAEAEDAGLLLELEMMALQVSLEAMPQLPEPLFLALNVSPSTLGSEALHRLFSGFDASRIVVEVTEHAPIGDYESLRDSLVQLRKLGVRVAIDDAGAGFASMQHILRLEPEFIKLDRTLIHDIELDRSKQALAAGLISFADGIGALLIAEGVERPAELEMLGKLGVPLAQGHLFARPAPLPVPLLAAPAEGPTGQTRGRTAA